MATTLTHLDRLARSITNAKLSRLLKSEVHIEKPGMARVTAAFHEDFTQNANLLCGAIVFEVADTAGFVAANSLEETFSVLTVDYHINFMKPVVGEGVYALGEVINRGKSIIVARSQVYSNSGKLVAAGQGTYMVSQIPLAGIEGYKDS